MLVCRGWFSPIVDRPWLLTKDCSPWSVDYRLSTMVRGLSTIDYGPWSVVYRLWSVVCGLSTIDYGPWSVVYRLSTMVRGLSTIDYRLWSVVFFNHNSNSDPSTVQPLLLPYLFSQRNLPLGLSQFSQGRSICFADVRNRNR